MVSRIYSGATGWPWIAFFIVVVAATSVAAYIYFRTQTGRIRAERYQDLAAIAKLKAGQIEDWRNERLRDVSRASRGVPLRNAIEEWVRNPRNDSLEQQLLEMLVLEQKEEGFANVLLLDTKHHILLSTEPHPSDIGLDQKHVVEQAVANRTPMLSDLYLSTSGNVRLDAVAPVLDNTGQPMAVLVLTSNAGPVLYPLIMSWPTPSPTAETLLVRKDGQDVLFLNDLRHRAGSALSLRYPLDRLDLPAAQAVLGRRGEFFGKDYRGKEVLADLRAIRDSPWFMVAKVDASEILAEAQYRRGMVVLLLALFIVLAASITAYGYRRRQTRIYRELYRSERAQREALKEFRTTLYSIGEAVITTDTLGSIKQMNPEAERLTGWTEAQAIGRHLDEVFHIVNEGTHEEVESPVGRVLREGTVVGLANHTALIAKDGHEFPIADSGAPIRDEGGTIIGVVLVFRDQTEERAAQEALHSVSSRIEAILAAVPDIVMEVDVNRVYTWANQAGIEFFGEDVIGKEASSYFEGEQETYVSVAPIFAGSEEVFYVESWQRRKDGQKRLLAWWCRGLKDNEGNVVGALSTARDITASYDTLLNLENERAHLRTLVQTIPDLIWLKDPNGVYITCNSAFERFFCAAEPDIVGKTDYDFVDAELAGFFRQKDKEAIAAGGPSVNEEWVTFADDGHRALLETIKTPMFDSGGRLIGVLGIARDITAMRQAEEALRESEQRVRRKLNSILEPDGDIGTLELGDLIDVQAMQSLMDDFFRLTNIGIGLVDTSGKVLVGTGWQDICTQFHRVHPETNKYCLESDLLLSGDVEPGHFKLYRCKNNMWDIATPIVVGGRHVGNLFLGQFFFDDEELDYDLFREQARRYGFDEDEYMAALDRVPRWSRQKVDTVMTFYTKFANMASSLSLGAIKLARTLAEREQLLHDLSESEEKYRILVENAGEAIFVAQDGLVCFANAKTEELTGYPNADLLSRPFVDFLHPDDRELVSERHVKRQQGMDVPSNYTFRIVQRSGEVRWVQLSAVRIEWLGSAATLNFMSDVTAARESEEAQRRLTTAIEQTGEGIFITDTEGTIQYVNPGFQKMTGYSADELIGSNPRIVKSGEHDAEFYRQLWDTIKAGKIWEGRLINRRKDGRPYHEEASISPIKDASGTIVNFVAVKRDITENVELSRQLMQAQKMEAVGTLAGGVAHDFNNILQVALGYSELVLGDEELPEHLRADVGKINESARRGADLVQRLLAFSKKVQPKLQPLNLNRRINEMRKMLERTIPKMIDIQLFLAKDLAAINADPIQVDQVLINLAVNARDAMPEGGRLIIQTADIHLDEEYARRHLGTQPGNYVLLTVTDTGIGMGRETLEHVFEPFYTTKETGKGTGLGLAMVLGIVEQHGGHIRCYSEIGQGTTFKIYFPVLASDHESEEIPPHTIPSGGSETILLVDDDDLVRALGATILTRAGYTVLPVSNGNEALAVYRRQGHEVSLVILDLVMPEMSGKQCLQALLQLDPTVKVIIASGYSADGPTQEAIATGARGFVDKPYDIRQVLGVVRNVLDSA